MEVEKVCPYCKNCGHQDVEETKLPVGGTKDQPLVQPVYHCPKCNNTERKEPYKPKPEIVV